MKAMVSNMKQRLITAVFGFAVLTPVLLFSDTIVLPIALAFFSALGVWEMLGCIGLRDRLSVLIPSLLVASAIPFAARYITKSVGKTSYTIAISGVILFIYMYYMLCNSVTSKGKLSILDTSLVFLTTLYITIGFTSIVLLRDLPHGHLLILLVFIGAWVTDGAAYFVGRAFGKHKLIPDVSPKKTVEGAIGGSVFCAISFIIFGIAAGKITTYSANIIEIAAAGIVISVISQFGDLIASLIKRHYGIKDYGKLFPGHGGVMDRFDSIIAIAPFLLMICAYPEIFSLFR